MDDSQFWKQLEFYSNAIVAFIVIQSLTFCYNFGTSVNFHNIIKTNLGLSCSLTVAVFIVMILALYANKFIGSRLQQLNEKHQKTIKTIYRGKAVAMRADTESDGNSAPQNDALVLWQLDVPQALSDCFTE